MMPPLPLITTRIAEPLDVSFYLNASQAEWDSMMQARYGPDWELDDECDTPLSAICTQVSDKMEQSNG